MSAPSARLHHMDALRCFCMLYGLLVHASTIGWTPLFSVITNSSDHFRMSTFFLVSGFFTAMVADRSEVRAFVANRGRLLLLPLVAGVLLLNPVTTWLIQLFHGGDATLAEWFSGRMLQPAPGPVVWYLHLWFLIALFTYAMLTPLLLQLAGSRPATWAVERLTSLPWLPRMFALTLVVASVVIAMRALSELAGAGSLSVSTGFLIMATCNYFAYFLVGLFAWRHRALFETLHSFFWPGLILFGGLYFLHPMLADGMPRVLERMLFWLSRAGFIFLIVCTLLAVARRLVKGGSPFLTRMTDGVYTFYIFHFLAIYVIANLMHLVTGNLYLIFCGIVLAGYPLLFLLHERVIAPSPLLALLFNGKIAKKAVPA